MRKAQLPTTKCTDCRDGRVPSRDAGPFLQREREERGVTRTALVPHFGFSESYTIDLEKGARPLTWVLVDKYRDAIEKAVQARLKEGVPA